MTSDVVRVAVVGAGPAGLAVADRLAEFAPRVRVTLIDQQELPGGQYYRLPSGAPALHGATNRERTARALTDRILGCHGMDFFGGTSVLGPVRTGLLAKNERSGQVMTVPADVVVVATGAREHVRPFPGWDGPRVVTGGLLSHQIRTDGTGVPGTVLLAGSGPFLLSLAHECLEAGIRVEMTLERAAPYGAGTALGAHMLDLPRVWEGARFLFGLARAGALPVQGSWIAGAVPTTDGRVEVTTDGRRPGTVTVDLVAVSDGFTPNTGLAATLGVPLKTNAHGVPQVAVDPWGRTRDPSVYAAGESCGVGGHHLAWLRGRVVAEAIAVDCGISQPNTSQRLLLRRLRGAERRYDTLQARYALGADPGAAATPESTTVCRCEQVTAQTLKRVVDSGVTDRFLIRQQTRMAMGLCQGRECSRFLGDYLRCRTGTTPPPARDRFPLEPIAAGALIEALGGTDGSP